MLRDNVYDGFQFVGSETISCQIGLYQMGLCAGSMCVNAKSL